MTDEVKADKEWDQVSKDREAQTQAVESDQPVVPDKAEVVVEADPLASLPEPTRKLIEGLQAKNAEYDGRFQKMGQQLATAHGTIGNLKQWLDESHAKLQTIAPVAEAIAVENEAKEKARKDAKAGYRAKAREKLGDFLDPEELDVLLPADAEPAPRAELKQEPRPEPKAEVVDPNVPDKDTQAQLMVDLADRVPGWRKIRDTQEFQAWLPAQSADIKAKANSWDPDEAASVFQAFDKHKSDAAQVARVEKDRQERLRRGESIQGRGSSTGDVDTGPDALWNKVTRDREKARASG